MGRSAVTADRVQKKKSQYIASAQREFDKTRTEIDRLQMEAQSVSVPSRTRIDEQIRLLQEKWDVAEQRLSQVRSATAQSWDDVRAGLDKALEDLRRSSTKAKKENG